ncbi:MAG TPA: MarR family winged helix-turn-helix transcriptional regulator [Herbaspirillum sp.]|uniref:MarR family winged helix-turn-helix transcriptional regulator n=1 Tax=Herbaspirillum sp. TaxID=1890675 RepID=UPI002D619DA2|nr:MarR family winged helix-turn-helix transcriptional regulator [Herbaspirillum sp.]HZG20052.1 MarR family winged helix-turn-helix transcriptional regulator [Herbaspirillum sp.]
MKLQAFFPYQLAQLAEAVSRSVASVYADRFGLSRDEWRILAALAEQGEMQGSDLVPHTSLDKMQVSRALGRMETAGLIRREPSPEDARARIVKPTAQARRLYRKIVPMVEAREAFLLEALSTAERDALMRALDKVRERALQDLTDA